MDGIWKLSAKIGAKLVVAVPFGSVQLAQPRTQFSNCPARFHSVLYGARKERFNFIVHGEIHNEMNSRGIATVV
jgi:hypothetical protein